MDGRSASRCVRTGLGPGEMVALGLGSEVVAPVSSGAGQPRGNSSLKTGVEASPRACLNPTTNCGLDAENAVGSGTVHLWLLEVPEGSC